MKSRKIKQQDEDMLKKLQRMRIKILEENKALEALIESLSEKKKPQKND